MPSEFLSAVDTPGAAQVFKLPAVKSNSVAVGDCDDRVSVRNRLKQGVEGSIAEMSTPPSKNCCGPRTWPALELSTQGVVTLHVSLSFKPHAAGRTYDVLALARADDGTVQGFHRAGSIRVGS